MFSILTFNQYVLKHFNDADSCLAPRTYVNLYSFIYFTAVIKIISMVLSRECEIAGWADLPCISFSLLLL